MPELAPVTIIVRASSAMRFAVLTIFVCDALRKSGIMLCFACNRGGRRIDDVARLASELRERLRNRLEASVAAYDAEAQLVGCLIEGWERFERRIVVGPAPPKRAERTALVKAIQYAGGILCHVGFVQACEAVNAVSPRRAFGIAELGKEDAFAAERLLQLTKKRNHVGIQPIARELAVHRIAVHRRERPGRRDARRPQVAILPQVFAVHSGGRAYSRRFQERVGKTRAPLRGIVLRFGLAQV